MFVILGRSMAAFVSRGSASRRFVALAAFLLLSLFGVFAPTACAVVVRGVVTDALGKPIPLARIQLIRGQKAVAVGVSGLDGSYEIRSTESGRFTLLTSSTSFYPGIGQDFYGGSIDEVVQNIVLETSSVREDITVTATGTPTPVEQSSAAVTLIPESDLATTVGIADALRQSPGVDVVQTGQAGGVTSLFVRGGNSTANEVLIDGIPANDVGGTFDFGTVSSTGVAGMELYRGPNSALYGTDAGASVVSLETPRGSSIRPVFNYSGDAGNFHTWRDEASLSGAHQKFDYYGAFSRFDTSNALPRDQYHSATAAANLGYSITANTFARFTIRNADSATGLPGAHDFYGISASGKQKDQDIYSGLTLENRIAAGWHNLISYGIARKREQAQQFGNVGTPITYNFGTVPCSAPTADCFTEYFGNVVTIRGANGYTATGQASFFVPTEKQDSNRDELYYQSDYSFSHYLTALFGFRYENERGSYVSAFSNETIQRTNFEYTLQLQGDIKNRLFLLGGRRVWRRTTCMASRGTANRHFVCCRCGLGRSGSTGRWCAPTRLRAYRSRRLPFRLQACIRCCSRRGTPPILRSTTSCRRGRRSRVRMMWVPTRTSRAKSWCSRSTTFAAHLITNWKESTLARWSRYSAIRRAWPTAFLSRRI